MKKICFVFLLMTFMSLTAFASGKVHWGYEGHEGPGNWGNLSEDFFACKDGRSQSPVNIITKETINVDMPAISFNYKDSAVNLVNNGHALQQNYDGGSYIVINGVKFQLLQFHFHAPSENTVNGKYFAMEAHLVHRSDSGELAVVGVLLEKGDTNKFMDIFWSSMPKEAGKEKKLNKKINASDFLPSDKRYYHFDGSLTTPPCSEGVHWYVLQNPVPVSEKQVSAFTKNIIEHNERPVQPLNARNILKNSK